jgi:hypothetical protein
LDRVTGAEHPKLFLNPQGEIQETTLKPSSVKNSRW